MQSKAGSKVKANTKPKAKRKTPARTRAVHAARPRSDDADAFIRDPEGGPVRAADDLAEMLGEDFIEGATQGDEGLESELERPQASEIGGPFVVTRARDELAFDIDASNPVDATAEPIPKPIAGLVQRPPRIDDAEDDDAQDEGDDDRD
jgi:hypothetical protein